MLSRFCLPALFLAFAFNPHPPACAQVIYDGFNYTSGANLRLQNGGTGFSTAWVDRQSAGSGSRARIQSGSLPYGDLLVSGNSVNDFSSLSDENVNADSTMERLLTPGLFSASVSDTFWVSFLVRRESNSSNDPDLTDSATPPETNGFQLSLLGYQNSQRSNAEIIIGDDSSDHEDRYGITVKAVVNDLNVQQDTYATPNAASPDVTSDLGNVDFLVAKISFNTGPALPSGGLAETVRLFINPAPGDNAPADGDAVAVATTLSNITEFGEVHFTHYLNISTWSFDELRIDPLYKNVAPVPEPSSMLLLSGAGFFLMQVRRRRR